MRLEDLNWMDVERYLKIDDRLMIVLGAASSTPISLHPTQKSAGAGGGGQQTSGVLVAPAMPYGVSPHFAAYPGTISLRSDTFLVVEDLVRSVHQAGFRRILVLNGHAGNQIARARLVELINELPGLKIAWYEWWLSHSIEAIALKYELKRGHANWMEAFPFARVSELPEEPKIPPAYRGLLGAEETRKRFDDGSFGGPYQVSAEIMDEILAAAIADVIELLNF